MLKKINDEDVGFIRRIAQIGVWRIAREYQQCLREIEYYAKSYVRKYLPECSFGSWYFEDDTEIVIVHKREDKEYCQNVDLQELVEEGLKSTYLCRSNQC